MKKMRCLHLLVLLALFFLPVYSSAQGLIILSIDDNGGSGECIDYGPISMAEGLIGTIEIPKIFVTNLGSNRINLYNLPVGTAPMFLEFKLDDHIVNFPLTQFVLSSYEENLGNPDYAYFHSLPTSFTFDFTGYCTDSGTNALLVGAVEIDYTWRLVDAYGNDYPIHDEEYSQPNGIFSCEAFAATSADCGPIIPNDPTASSVVESCVEASLQCSPDDLSLNKFTDKGGIQHFGPSTSKITPNPFNEELQLEYQMETEGDLRISIFNAQGQIVARLKNHAEAGVFRQTIDTSQWSNGIYYCKIQSKQTNKAFRLIKAH